jgi:hypothetical protein
LRDELDQFILQYALVDSFNNFVSKKERYPFVAKRELKPRARIPDLEYGSHNTFLLLFVEEAVPAIHKKYIRFFNDNKVTLANLLNSQALTLSEKYDRSQKYLESVQFFNFLKDLLPVDYALLIQRDQVIKKRHHYALSHFHVRVDWPIAEAAEDLAKNLRYVSQDLYEKGDKYAEDVQKKFFEYYGVPVMVGGRRTAAIVAAQYFKRINCITTVYVGSSESRALIRISERGTSRIVLMQFKETDINEIAANSRLKPQTFKKNYVVAKYRKKSICMFQTTYAYTNHARPPDDGKLRNIKPDLNWLSVSGQHILPKPGAWKYAPIPLNLIYT